MSEQAIAARLGLAEKQEQLIAALTGTDALGVVVRAHIHVEHEVIAFIRARLPKPDALDAIGLNYDGRVKLAIALGLPENFKNALSFLGTLRNKFAHRLDATIGEQEAKNFEQAMGPERLVGVDAYIRTHEKLGATEKPIPFVKLTPTDRFILLAQTLWAGLAVAAIKVGSSSEVE